MPSSSLNRPAFIAGGDPIPPETIRLVVWIIGPLNADLFLLAKTRLDDGEYDNGAGTPSLNADADADAVPPLVSFASCNPLFTSLTYRILLGRRAEDAGVVGSTLTDPCGVLDAFAVGVKEVSPLFDEMDDALECVWLR